MGQVSIMERDKVSGGPNVHKLNGSVLVKVWTYDLKNGSPKLHRNNAARLGGSVATKLSATQSSVSV